MKLVSSISADKSRQQTIEQSLNATRFRSRLRLLSRFDGRSCDSVAIMSLNDVCPPICKNYAFILDSI